MAKDAPAHAAPTELGCIQGTSVCYKQVAPLELKMTRQYLQKDTGVHCPTRRGRGAGIAPRGGTLQVCGSEAKLRRSVMFIEICNFNGSI